jgi:ligand-binding SRPBCC domain-containing protein
MSVKNFQFKQVLPIDIKTAWDFFSDPANLSKITPPEMNFIIHTDLTNKRAYAGQMICYTVSPVFNIPMSWVTEITHVNEPHYFVDEQRKGPYSMWHHEHHFKTIEGGVEMTDILHYEVPLGVIGNILNAVMIEKKVKGIFEYRTKVLDELFKKKLNKKGEPN